MFKKVIKRNIFIFSVFLMAFLFGGNVIAEECNKANKYCNYGLNQTADDSLKTTLGGDDAALKIGKIIGAALSLLGVIFLVLMIYGGFLWMTAKGDSSQVDKAKGLMAAAIIGLIIVLSAYAITYYITDVLTKEPAVSSS